MANTYLAGHPRLRHTYFWFILFNALVVYLIWLMITRLVSSVMYDGISTCQLQPLISFPTQHVTNTTFCLMLTHYHTIPHFDALKICSCRKHCEKEKIACNKQFLLFLQCLLPCMVLIFHFKCTLKHRLQFVSVTTSLKFCRLVMG